MKHVKKPNSIGKAYISFGIHRMNKKTIGINDRNRGGIWKQMN